MDTEGVVKAELPIELMMILQREMQFGFNIDEDIGGREEGGEGEETRMEEDQNRHLFGYLLAWMLVFDLFQDAVGRTLSILFFVEVDLAFVQSIKVKSNYIEQLRNHDMVVGHLIPCFLSLLRLDQGSLLKVFKLDVWGVDEFYIDRQYSSPFVFMSIYFFFSIRTWKSTHHPCPGCTSILPGLAHDSVTHPFMGTGLQRPTINKRRDHIHLYTLLPSDHPCRARACPDAFCLHRK